MQIETSPGIVQRAIHDLQLAGLRIEPLRPSGMRNVSCRTEPSPGSPSAGPHRCGIGRGAVARAAVEQALAPPIRRPTTLNLAASAADTARPAPPPSGNGVSPRMATVTSRTLDDIHATGTRVDAAIQIDPTTEAQPTAHLQRIQNEIRADQLRAVMSPYD